MNTAYNEALRLWELALLFSDKEDYYGCVDTYLCIMKRKIEMEVQLRKVYCVQPL